MYLGEQWASQWTLLSLLLPMGVEYSRLAVSMELVLREPKREGLASRWVCDALSRVDFNAITLKRRLCR